MYVCVCVWMHVIQYFICVLNFFKLELELSCFILFLFRISGSQLRLSFFLFVFLLILFSRYLIEHIIIYLRAQIWAPPASPNGFNLKSRWLKTTDFLSNNTLTIPAIPSLPIMLLTNRRTFSRLCNDRNSATACAPKSNSLQCEKSNSSSYLEQKTNGQIKF